ncbi:MAG: 5-(carboxyamino)imidazole ribonucleotide synthase [Planctomycetaceae bacterium]|nr:5-(carboxyamino)imidazole ribonucleotide synthase [Planctomycetaceae bacterium]
MVTNSNKHSVKHIAPGATLGMLGGGQLGRMFAIAARRMGYRVLMFGDPSDSPAGQVCDRSWDASFTDFERLKEFAELVDVVSYEQENIPVETVEFLMPLVPVRPGVDLLKASQHRISEKTALRSIGIPTANFAPIRSETELASVLPAFDGRGILKTTRMGYDGKGQVRIECPDDAAEAWQTLKTDEAILEEEIHFSHEISIVAARFTNGDVTCFQPSVNQHVNHILDVSVSPSELLNESTTKEAAEIARAVLEHFDAVGVLCVEFFVTAEGRLLVNEIAPRPHNSGHLTIDACCSCQFEQQVRAICGMPSGNVFQAQPAAMINLLGDHLMTATPDRWNSLLHRPGVHVHMYGKAETRTGRKMGHLTVTAESAQAAREMAISARHVLMGIQ